MDEHRLADHVVNAIQRLLDEQGMSASELARKMGVSQPYLWRRLSREVDFSVTDIELAAAILGVPASGLMPAAAA